MNNENNTINEISADFAVYLNPDLMKEEYSIVLSGFKFKKVEMEKYLELLADVQYAWQKILKYEIYFADFYPASEKIEKFEALYHHIHAYLQDMTILKNKIEVFIDSMKNDIKKIAKNKADTDAFFKAAVEKTEEVFANISKHRNPHHHKGMRFIDSDLIKAENADITSKKFQIPIFDEMLNQERKPELMKRLALDKEESFEKAKAKWIKTANQNSVQVTGYEGTLSKIKECLESSVMPEPKEGCDHCAYWYARRKFEK